MTDPIQHATSLIHCGQWASAAGILYGALTETPDDETALALMVVCKWQLEAFDTAEAVACQLVRSAPHNPTGHYLLAQIYLHRGDSDAAYRAVQACLHTNPNGVEALKLCIAIQRRRHEWSDARATRRYLESVNPGRAGSDSLVQRARRWWRAHQADYRPCLVVFCQAA